MSEINSRERLLAAIRHEQVDYIPMSFMIFSALRTRLNKKLLKEGPLADIETQLALGLDVPVDLRYFHRDTEGIGHSDAEGLPVRFKDAVRCREWSEKMQGSDYPILHKIYETPDGDLSVSVKQTNDWPYYPSSGHGYMVPFMDDFLAPRCSKYLIEKRKDLESLKHLLIPPFKEDLEMCFRSWEHGKEIAGKYGLMLTGGWGVGADALAWFCGHEKAIFIAMEEPDFLADLLDMVHAWNMPRMKAFLDFGVDLFIRRAWYEGTDFWSPELFRQFFYPVIREEVKLAHDAGSKYGYIMTSGTMPLLDMLVELDIDVLIGIDPVEGKGTDMEKMKERLKEKICLWGGVNGFVTIEMGNEKEIDHAVKMAMETLGPEGFILSPVDNITDPSDEVWEKVLGMIECWKKYR